MDDGTTTGLGAGGGGEENAFSFLPDGLQSLAEGYEKPETFWADVSRLKGMDKELSALRGVTPETLATDEDVNKAFRALGKPEQKDGYKLPDAWDGDVWTPDGKGAGKASEAIAAQVNEHLRGDAEQFREIAHRCNLTDKQASALWNLYGSVIARGVERQLSARADPEKVVADLWPQETATHLDAARRGARAVGIGDALDNAGLSSNPLVLKLAHALGEALGEDRIVGTATGGASLPTGAAAREELHRVIGSEAYKSGDKQALRMAEALSARVHLK